MLFLVVLLYSSSSEQRRISHGTAQIHNLSLDGRLLVTGRSFCHGISGPVTPKTADKVHRTPIPLAMSPRPSLLSMPTNADTQRTLSATTRPCHRSRRRRAPVQRCCPALHRREQQQRYRGPGPCTTRLLRSYTPGRRTPTCRRHTECTKEHRRPTSP
jgi:hypothetical protein